jgi:hypothetical protein
MESDKVGELDVCDERRPTNPVSAPDHHLDLMDQVGRGVRGVAFLRSPRKPHCGEANDSSHGLYDEAAATETDMTVITRPLSSEPANSEPMQEPLRSEPLHSEPEVTLIMTEADLHPDLRAVLEEARRRNRECIYGREGDTQIILLDGCIDDGK